MSVVIQINCVGGITCGPRACSKSFFFAVKPVTPGRVIHFLCARALAWTKKKLKLARNGNHFSSICYLNGTLVCTPVFPLNMN